MTEGEPMDKQKIAFFDFDGTLCAGDSSVPWLFFCLKNGIAPKRHLFKAVAAYIHSIRHPEDMASVKSIVYEYLKGKTVEEVNGIARKFFAECQSKRFFQDGIAELKRLREQGYHIVIVSASPMYYMNVLPEFLPVDAVIATPCLTDNHGKYIGQIGENCRGEQKPVVIRRYIEQNGLTVDEESVRAYGDSKHDYPMLSMAATPVMVNPKKKLKEKMPDALKVNWH